MQKCEHYHLGKGGRQALCFTHTHLAHVTKAVGGEIRSLSSNRGSTISSLQHLNESFPFSELGVLIYKRKGLVWKCAEVLSGSQALRESR